MERTKQSSIAGIICIAILALCPHAPAKTIYVDDDAPPGGDGSSWARTYRYLQDALTKAGNLKVPTEIHVAQGTYKPDRSSAHPDGTRDRFASFTLVNDVAVKGGFAGVGTPNPDARDIRLYETILSGDLAGDDIPVFDPCDLLTERMRRENSIAVVRTWSCSRSAVLEGCTITAGSAMGVDGRTAGGSGLYLSGSSQSPSCPSIRDCIFVANHGAAGGAVHVSQGAPEFANCMFVQNASIAAGGAIDVLAGNYSSSAYPFVIKGCTFGGNYAETTGGAMNIRYLSDLHTIEACTFTRNSSRRGGALFVDSGTRENVANCLFLHNEASDAGGAVYFSTSRLSMASTSFFGNTATQGTAVACFERLYKGLGPLVKISNTILRNGGDEIHVPEAAQVDATYSDIQGGWPGEGNINADPLFADPVNWNPDTPHDSNDPWIAGDYHLKSQAGRWDPNTQSWVKDDVTSPCIDAGDPNSPIGEEPFPNGGRINMGAYGGTAEASKSYFGQPEPGETLSLGRGSAYAPRGGARRLPGGHLR